MRPITVWHPYDPHEAPVGSRWKKFGTRVAPYASQRIITITKVPTIDAPYYEAFKGGAKNQTIRLPSLSRYWRID